MECGASARMNRCKVRKVWRSPQDCSTPVDRPDDCRIYRLILEAFSAYLQLEQNRDISPEQALMAWLTRILLMPPAPNDMVGRVIHAEIRMLECEGRTLFEGKSNTGRQLLKSLIQFCRSFDHWQFTRWVHELRASDFNRKYGS